MVRPNKLYRYKKHKDSIEVWFDGERIGNVSAPLLRMTAELSRRYGVSEVLVHLQYLKNHLESGGFGAKSPEQPRIDVKKGVSGAQRPLYPER
jgi:hypothetical protein